MKSLFNTIYLFVLFLFFSITGYAQLYPVQLTPIFNSPYSVKISDYATSMDTKMQLLINPTDITISQRQVRLKLYIQGNGLNIQSSDYMQGQRPIFINGGELQTLTNTDISALFRLENLQGITPQQYANGLPEGMYNFCFEMYDYMTNQKIAQKSCASLYLILNDPPLLNTPQKNEQIAATDFPNILFTWTPRQRNATNISYKFELKQLIDPTLDPQFAFQMSPVLYEETLFGTALLYNLNMPILVPGMRYAWRVRAISMTGLSENAVFKNDGYSEIYSFKYTAACAAPTFLLSETQNSKSVKITWEGVPEHTRYQVQYKKQDVRNAQWFSTNSLNTQSLITNLEPGVTYQFRVGSSCDPATDGIQSFTYSGISTFTTPTQTSGVPAYNCGIVPQINIQNQKPLTNLIQSETFKAGDFPVTILELQGENSPYSGRGYIIVPYLADTKIAVEFNNIVVNTDYQLISGIVETSYNPEEKNVTNVEDFTGEGQGGQIEETVPFEIDKIVIDPKGDIIVNGKGGEQVTIPGGKDTVITDSTGKIYNVDKDGNGTNEPTARAEGGKSTAENTDGVDKNGQVTEFTAKGITIAFSNIEDPDKNKGSKYAFDVMPKGVPTALEKLYKKVGTVALTYKAVVNGNSDVLQGIVSVTDSNIKLDSIVFKTENGGKVDAVRNDKTFKLTVKGKLTYAEEQILATIKQGDKWKVIGAFMLVHISPKEVNVALVPTDDASKDKLDAIAVKTQDIYSKVGVKINFTKEGLLKGFNDVVSGNTIQTDKNTITSTYSTVQQDINALYKESGNSYVLFITNKESSTKQQGYMRLNGQFGYVFKSGLAKTPAHELGHGVFKLEHPFEQYKISESSTDLLMDYSSGTVLNHQDWKQINDPAFKLYAFQSQASGEFAGGYVVSPDYKLFSIGTDRTKVDKNTYSSNDITANDGTLPGFVLNGNQYWWKEGKYVNASTSYTLTDVSDKINALKDKWLFLFFDKENDCGKRTYVSVRIADYIASKKTLKDFIEQYKDSKAKELIICDDPNVKNWNEINGSAGGSNTVFVDYSNGKDGKSPFSNEQKSEMGTTITGIDAGLGTNLKVYLLNTGNPNYTVQKAEAESDKSENKLIFTYSEQSKKIDLQHKFSVPKWLADVLPATDSNSSCALEYINEGLAELHKNSVYKASLSFDQALQEAKVVAYRAVFGMAYCATNEEAVQNSNAATKYVAGALHEVIATVDLVELVNGLTKMATSAVNASINSYKEFYQDIKKTCEELKSGQAIEPAVLAKRLLPPGIRNDIKLYNTVVETAKQFSSFYFSDCDKYKLKNGKTGDICAYRYGQITVMIVPIVLTAGEYAFAKAGGLVARLKSISILGRTEEVANLLIDAEKAGKTIVSEAERIVIKEGDDIVTTVEKSGNEVIINKIEGLAKYKNIRKFLEDGNVKSYLTNDELVNFEKVLKTADKEVLETINNLEKVDEFAEIARGYKDSPGGFADAVAKTEKFHGKHGWLSYWRLTPRMENSLNTIHELKSAGKVANVGSATEIELASINAYTVNGNFINQPFRYEPSWFGEYNTRAIRHINEGLNQLRKVPGRLVKNVEVFSGKTFSKADFESKFVGKINTMHPYRGYMSTSKLESVAEGFIDLTKQWASGSGEKIAVIQRVTPKSGVYVDDISDWGKNLGKTSHPEPEFIKVQVQEEVLLNSEKLKQISEPIPVIENGVHKTIDGMKAYYVDFIEIL
ncbi:fibronectin type III domain-containing protein [Flavobacterium tructae]|uniref:fibronectin type III domain-containing protein n=1 Tax=Flavobacterium tructae TaxID=1114873 RepID=UPI0035A8222B